MIESITTRLEIERQVRRFMGVALRRWRWFILGIGLTTAVGGYKYLKAPRIYEARSQIVLSHNTPRIMGRRIESVVDTNALRWRNLKYERTQHRLMEGVELASSVAKSLNIHPAQLIKDLQALQASSAASSGNPFAGASPDLLERLERLRLTKSLSIEAAIETLSAARPGHPIIGMYRVVPQRDTDLIDIVVSHPERDWARTLATTVAEVFVQRNLEQRRSASAEAAAWLGQQVDVQRSKLEEAELALQEFKEANNIVSVSLRERTSMTMDALKSLSSALSKTISERVALEARLKVLEDFEGDFSALPEFKDGRLGTIQARLLSLRENWIDINATYTEAHPKYQALSRKIELTEVELSRVAKEEVKGLEGSLNILIGTERRLRQEVANLTELSLRLNRGQLDFERLQRDRQNAEQMYSLVLNRHKEAELESMLNLNNASIVKRATMPNLPISPLRRNFILVSLFLGGLLGIVLVIIREFLDSTIKTHEPLVDLGESFLGIFPKIESSESIERDLFVSVQPKSSAAECARALRTNLLFMNPESPPKTLAVTSASPQEGKSTIAIALATTMAQSGSRTLLIDADMRRPRLHKSLGKASKVHGLSSVIIGESKLSEAVERNVLPGLDLLCCGPIPPNPAELLHAPGFEALLRQLSESYDRVIFDAPPINPVSDPMVLANMIDGIVVVATSHQTRTPALSMAISRLQEVQAKILGLVLNKVTLKAGSGYGYGQYSYQYQYYSSSYAEDDTEQRSLESA